MKPDELPEGWTPKPRIQRLSRLWLLTALILIIAAIVAVRIL